MFAVDLELFPEVKYQNEDTELKRDLRNLCGWVKHNNPTSYSVPSISLSPELKPVLQAQSYLWGQSNCNQRDFKESSPTSWVSASSLLSFWDPVAILDPSSGTWVNII